MPQQFFQYITSKILLILLISSAILALSIDYGLPGHLSVDSLVQLYEGANGKSISFNPPLMSILLGGLLKIDLDPSKSFVVIVSLFYALAAALVLSQSTSLIRIVLAAALLCNPIIILYSGNVWKDVLMAHAVALSAGLIFLSQGKPFKQQAIIATALLLLSILIVGSRQQGLLFVLLGAIAFSLTISTHFLKRGIIAFGLFLSAIFLNNQITSNFENNKVISGSKVGLTIAIRYDLAGMLANGANIEFPNPEMRTELSGDAQDYSARRVDTLRGPARQIWGSSLDELGKIWFTAIKDNPSAYINHRINHFKWVMGLEEVKRCLPHYFGVSDYFHGGVQLNLTQELGLQDRVGLDYSKHKILAKEIIDTALYQHWLYLSVLSFLTIAFAFMRQWPAMILALAGVGFSLSFLFVSIACDFRYVYSSLVLCGLLSTYFTLKVWGRNEATAC